MTTIGLGPEIATAHVAVSASFRGLDTDVRRKAGAAGRSLGTSLSQSASAGARSAGSKAGEEFGGGFAEKVNMAFKNVFLYGGAYAAISGVQRLLSAAGKAAIGFNSTLEQTSISFETLLGSAKAADTELAWLQRFARETPYQFSNLTLADQQLIAMGFNASAAHDALVAIGDATAGLGRGQDEISRMVLALGQMETKGRVQSQELLQLQEAGVPALKILAAQFGTTTDQMQKMVTKGQVLSQQAIPALVAGLEDGTSATRGFGGEMERQSHTFAGAVSNIEDSLTQLTAAAATPAFVEISKDLQRFSDELTSPQAQAAINGLQTITDLLVKTGHAATAAFGPFGLLGKQIEQSLGVIGKVGGALGSVKASDYGPVGPVLSNIIRDVPLAGSVLHLFGGNAKDAGDAASGAAESLTDLDVSLNVVARTTGRYSEKSLDLSKALKELRADARAAAIDTDKSLTPAMAEFGKAAGLTAMQTETLQSAMGHVSDGTYAFVASLDARTAAVLGLAQAQAVLVGTQYAVDRASGGASAGLVGGELAKVQGLIGSIKQFQTDVPIINAAKGSGGTKKGPKYDPWAAFLKDFNSSHAKSYVHSSGESVARFLIEGFGDELNKQGKLTLAGLDGLGVEKWSKGAAKHIRSDFADALKDVRSKLKDVKSELAAGQSSVFSSFAGDFFSAQGSTDFFGNTIAGSTGQSALALALADASKLKTAAGAESSLNSALGPKYNDFLNSLLASGNFGQLTDLAGNTDLAKQIGDAFNLSQQYAARAFDASPQGQRLLAQEQKLDNIASALAPLVSISTYLLNLSNNDLTAAEKREYVKNLNTAMKALANAPVVTLSKVGGH